MIVVLIIIIVCEIILQYHHKVNHVWCVIPTVPYTDPVCGVLRIISKILSLNYLHREIREKGGAYGVVVYKINVYLQC